VGTEAAVGAFLVVQHADLPVQQHYLPIIEKAVQEGEASGSSLALLQDRVLMREGRKTLYGTQLRRNEETGEWFLWPIENEEEVDARRAAMGMVPLAAELARYPFEIVPVPDNFELLPVP